MRLLLLLPIMFISLSASGLGDKVSDSTDTEKQIEDVSKNINETIVDVVAISTYNLFLKDKIVFYAQKEKELVSLTKEQ